MIEMFSEKKNSSSKKKSYCFIQGIIKASFEISRPFRSIHHFHPIFPQILPRSTSLNPSIEIDVLMNFINTQHIVLQ